ncbi:MAG: outer membrane lipid asymmetry maintenance protein MlaD [Halomonadaceae bacterium]|nr:MAG: outer membrane lipid asymmetry maintenance protein MlaD [Halomonadaceae bacterium]
MKTVHGRGSILWVWALLLLLLAVAVLAFTLARASYFQLNSGQTYYQVYAEFHDVGGLQAGARVSLSGVTVGKVTDVALDSGRYRATVTLEIARDIDHIAMDSMAIIRTAGLVGERYVDISPGGDPDSMAEGDYFYETQSALHLEQFIGRFVAGWR